MTLPSMESIFLILSGVILAAGVLYWFWSHIQLTQKKVQLLENAVFELRGMLSNPGPPAPAPVEVEAPVYNDLADDDGEGDWEAPVPNPASTTLEELASDLQPGGGAGQGIVVSEEPPTNEQFRELFIQHERLPTPPVKAQAPSESLESMPVKELRRLAEKRGVVGVNDLKKKELLAALRQQAAPPSVPVATSPEAKEVSVERTLDLTETVEELQDATVLE